MANENGLTPQENYELRKVELERKNLQERKEQSELEFKRDCRRTALQLAERMSGKGERSAIGTLSEAEVLYQWLINIGNEDSSKALLDFYATGKLPVTKE